MCLYSVLLCHVLLATLVKVACLHVFLRQDSSVPCHAMPLDEAVCAIFL